MLLLLAASLVLLLKRLLLLTTCCCVRGGPRDTQLAWCCGGARACLRAKGALHFGGVRPKCDQPPRVFVTFLPGLVRVLRRQASHGQMPRICHMPKNRCYLRIDGVARPAVDSA